MKLLSIFFFNFVLLCIPTFAEEIMNKSEILKETNNYLYNIFQINKTINFYISSSWSIIHEKDDMAESHYHVNSFVSGVYYFKTPKNCGNILFQRNRFTNNLFSNSYSLPLNMVNEYNSYSHSVEVEECKLLLFHCNSIGILSTDLCKIKL